ncbi:hypothetical protein [Microbacterium panaciterrae]
MGVPIAMDMDGVFALTKKILQSLQEFPAAESLAESKGGSSAVTAELRAEITKAAQQMSLTTAQIVEQVNAMHDEIKAAVARLVDADASMADEGKTLLSLLDSAEKQVAPTPDPGTTGAKPKNTAY